MKLKIFNEKGMEISFLIRIILLVLIVALLVGVILSLFNIKFGFGFIYKVFKKLGWLKWLKWLGIKLP